MDTSHLAEHAGTLGTLFASVFVVATTTMRTMIPLRVFGILANVVLIATAIPSHNYLTIVLQAVMLSLNSYRLHQMLQLVRDVKKSVNSDLSMECIEAGMILSVSYTKVEELYVQNPEFGFYFLRLASARLFQNIATLEQRLAQQAAHAAPKPA